MVLLTDILETIIIARIAGVLAQDHLAHALELTAVAVLIGQLIDLPYQVLLSPINRFSG